MLSGRQKAPHPPLSASLFNQACPALLFMPCGSRPQPRDPECLETILSHATRILAVSVRTFDIPASGLGAWPDFAPPLPPAANTPANQTVTSVHAAGPPCALADARACNWATWMAWLFFTSSTMQASSNMLLDPARSEQPLAEHTHRPRGCSLPFAG